MTPVARLYALPATGTTWTTGCPLRVNHLRSLQWGMLGSTTPPGSTSTRSVSNRPRFLAVKSKKEPSPNRRWRPSRLRDTTSRRCSPSTSDEWTSSPAHSAHRVHVSPSNVFNWHSSFLFSDASRCSSYAANRHFLVGGNAASDSLHTGGRNFWTSKQPHQTYEPPRRKFSDSETETIPTWVLNDFSLSHRHSCNMHPNSTLPLRHRFRHTVYHWWWGLGSSHPPDAAFKSSGMFF